MFRGSAAGLLRRHVARSTEHDPRTRHCGAAVQQLRQAEVAQLGCAVGQEEDVARREVTVDDAVLMGKVDGPRQRLDKPRCVAPGPWHPCEPFGKTATVGELHDQVRPSAKVPQLEELHDVGVTQAGHGFGFHAESSEPVGRVVEPGEDHLDGDAAMQPALPGPVNNPHATLTEPAQDFGTWDHRPGRARFTGRRTTGEICRISVRGVRNGRARCVAEGAVHVDLPPQLGPQLRKASRVFRDAR